jgi:hypothetical protein
MIRANGKYHIAVAAFARKLGLKIDVVARRVAIDLFDRIVLRTPVDTGRARASWQIGIGKASTFVRGKNYNNPGGAAGDARQQHANLARFKSGNGNRIFISNNLPYIGALEFGHSDQAPHGMVRISVAEVKAEIQARL